ncbi:MAG: hypothetical protein ACE5H4_14545 [Candidatus Thorarchaeota archaeon]
MTNAAEDVVRVWLQFCRKQFVMMNIPYPYMSKENKRMTREIDILATDGGEKFADYEIKWRTTDWIGATESEKIPALVEQLKNKHREKEIRTIIKESFGVVSAPAVRKVLVTPRKHFGKTAFAERIEALTSAGIELVWFEDILEDLFKYLEEPQDKGQYDPSTLAILRMARHLSK